MMAVKRGLGRGFDSLIPTKVIEEEFDVTSNTDGEVSELRHIRIEKIVRDEDQPRREFDEAAIEDLANSIREHGVISPIIVTAQGDKFQIVAGERRYRASRLAGLDTIPALVRTLSGQHKLELALIENAQREDLRPMEFATALAKMRDQFNMDQAQISQKIGKSITVISNHLRLLQLPDFARKAVVDGKLTEGHARQVLSLAPDEEAQRQLVNGIIKNGWSVRKAEQFVIAYKEGDNKGKSTKAAISGQNEFTKAFGKKIGFPVRQKVMGYGAGQIIIAYKTPKELEKLQKALDF
ncbi:chromosome partitioning protein ParB [Alphaproteobacteria bacterium]|nr:chromosome partitioning protein ParB [Alphaproteobacteria bacterium]